MSLCHKENIECPNCKKIGKKVIWESINVDLDPEMKEEIKSGKIFEYKCPKCKESFNIDYPLLYHDMTNKYFIYYTLDDKVPELPDEYNLLKGYKSRMVKSIHDFREKVIVLDDNYDDLIIEVIKMFILTKMEDKNFNDFLGIHFLNREKDDLVFEISFKTFTQNASIPYEMYEELKKNMKFNKLKEFEEVSIRTIGKLMK